MEVNILRTLLALLNVEESYTVYSDYVYVQAYPSQK